MIMSDFEKYQNLQTQMRQLIRDGRHNYQIFADAWEQSEGLKHKHGGIPAIPEGFDWDAWQQEQAEESNMQGTR